MSLCVEYLWYMLLLLLCILYGTYWMDIVMNIEEESVGEEWINAML